MRETYVIHVTKECNCDCSYCYEKDKTSKYTWEEIKVLLDNIMKYSKGDYMIEFLGGEPCLALDLIENTIVYTRASDYVITTNGTIINDKLITLLRANSNIRWVASIDGHQLANSLRKFKNGRNTYSSVSANVTKLLSCGVNEDQIACHITSHPYNIGYLKESIIHLYTLGFKHIGVGTIESTMTIDEKYCEIYVKHMKAISNMIHVGMLEGLKVSELVSLKPQDDIRTYIRDDSGKIVGESYGRAEDDITYQEIDGIKSERVHGQVTDMIHRIRKEVFDYHQNWELTLGCSTGRSGSKTLARYIAAETGKKTFHEAEKLPWTPDTILGTKNKTIRAILGEGDHCNVSSSIINYAEDIMKSYNVKIICVKRDREDFVKSFLAAHKLKQGERWGAMPNPEMYPSYDINTNIVQGLKLYWEIYYKRAERLAEKYEQFTLLDFDELIKYELKMPVIRKGHMFVPIDKLEWREDGDSKQGRNIRT